MPASDPGKNQRYGASKPKVVRKINPARIAPRTKMGPRQSPTQNFQRQYQRPYAPPFNAQGSSSGETPSYRDLSDSLEIGSANLAIKPRYRQGPQRQQLRRLRPVPLPSKVQRS